MFSEIYILIFINKFFNSWLCRKVQIPFDTKAERLLKFVFFLKSRKFNQKLVYSKNHDFCPVTVTVPLPSRYRFQVFVTHGHTPFIIVTL